MFKSILGLTMYKRDNKGYRYILHLLIAGTTDYMYIKINIFL